MGSDGFGDDLRRELARGAHAAGGDTITGTIRGTEGWLPEAESFYLCVTVPQITPPPNRSLLDRISLFKTPQQTLKFRDRMRIPDPDAPLSDSKFGRILKSAGYDRSTAPEIIGDTVDCRYEGDGEWAVVDPLYLDMIENANRTETHTQSRLRRRISRHKNGLLVGGWAITMLVLGLSLTFTMSLLAVGVVTLVLLLWFTGQIPPGDRRSLIRWLLKGTRSRRSSRQSDPTPSTAQLQETDPSDNSALVTVYEGTYETDVAVEGGRSQDVVVRLIHDGHRGSDRVGSSPGSSSQSPWSPTEQRGNPLDDRSRDLLNDD